MSVTIDLSPRVAVVTGGGSGLGKEAAPIVVEAGCKVYVVGRRADTIATAAAQVGAVPIAADISNPDAVSALIGGVEAENGRLDILVNSAGVATRGSAYDVPVADLDYMLSVNVSGLFACCQAAGRIMRRAGYGKIVNVASIASEIGTPTIASYAATKGAVRQLTKSLAVEWACDGIRVNAILPGWFRTEMTEASFQNPAWVEKIMRRIPLRREGVPADIEGTFLFLASPMSDYLTGAMIPVDGGALAS